MWKISTKADHDVTQFPQGLAMKLHASVVQTGDLASGEVVRLVIENLPGPPHEIAALALQSLANVIQWDVSEATNLPSSGQEVSASGFIDGNTAQVETLGMLARWQATLPDGAAFFENQAAYMEPLIELSEIVPLPAVESAISHFLARARKHYQVVWLPSSTSQEKRDDVERSVSSLRENLEKWMATTAQALAAKWRVVYHGWSEPPLIGGAPRPSHGSTIESEELWIRVSGMLQQDWAVVRQGEGDAVNVYYLDDRGRVSPRGYVFPFAGYAWRCLEREGFSRFDKSAPVRAPSSFDCKSL